MEILVCIKQVPESNKVEVDRLPGCSTVAALPPK